jgi:hypothetical protein
MNCIKNTSKQCCLKIITSDNIELPICGVSIVCDAIQTEEGTCNIDEHKKIWKRCLEPTLTRDQSIKGN